VVDHDRTAVGVAVRLRRPCGSLVHRERPAAYGQRAVPCVSKVRRHRIGDRCVARAAGRRDAKGWRKNNCSLRVVRQSLASFWLAAAPKGPDHFQRLESVPLDTHRRASPHSGQLCYRAPTGRPGQSEL
jgi:hypothetical protein